MNQRALIWLNKDFRVKDNQIFEWALEAQRDVMILAFPPKKASKFQLKFFWESLGDLQKSLEASNINIFTVDEEPEVEIAHWVKENGISEVLTTGFYNVREQDIINRVKKRISENTSAKLLLFDQRTLICKDDLPFSLDNLPLVFTHFRLQVENSWNVKLPVAPQIDQLKGFKVKIPSSASQVPRQNEFDVELPFDFVGGETAAWKRIEDYFWKTGSLSTYKITRNGMIEKNDSSKFSPWLAMGCLSPRSLYWEVKRYEEKFGANESTSWLIFELLWRDYFKFLSARIGEKLFFRDGIQSSIKVWSNDLKAFSRWCEGDTGLDFVDANMREIQQTGWMSNRGRQNVASFLAKNLKIDWTWGATHFENHLIDYDTESNWGNWQYVAGVGTDPRDRIFDIEKQAQLYDPDFQYRKRWLKV